jgi:hypothetical protein
MLSAEASKVQHDDFVMRGRRMQKNSAAKQLLP